MDWAKTVLVLIDIQNDYLPGGKFELLESEKASLQAKEVLEAYRRRKLPIIHVKHESVGSNATFFLPNTPGADIHPNVEPHPGEPVILKHKPSSFIDTNFETALRNRKTEHLVICGMQTNVCVRATILDALEKGYKVTVIEDAVAARNIEVHQAALKEMVEKQTRIVKSDGLLKSLSN